MVWLFSKDSSIVYGMLTKMEMEMGMNLIDVLFWELKESK